MEIKISDIRLSMVQAASPGQGSPLPVFKPGEVLSAQILARQPPDLYTLQIGGQTLQVRTDQPLSPGQTLKLEVAALQPQLELRIVAAAAAENPATQAIRQLLPQQQPLNLLLSNLAQVAAMPVMVDAAGRNGAIPDQLASLVRQLLSQLPSARQAASAEGLKRILLDSGFFLEHKLLQSPADAEAFDASLNHDLKTALLRFAQALRKMEAAGRPVTPAPDAGENIDLPGTELRPKTPTDPLAGKAAPGTSTTAIGSYTETTGSQPRPPASPLDERSHFPPLRSHRLQPQRAAAPSITQAMDDRVMLEELLRQTESSLSRIQLQQLSALPTPDEPLPVWSFEIPLRHEGRSDVLQLRIQQESNRNREATQKIWHVTLAFDLEGLGPVYASIRLQDRRISANLWLERAVTRNLFSEHLETLRRHMQDHGLLPGEITCFHGKPPQPQAPHVASGGFLDTRA